MGSRYGVRTRKRVAAVAVQKTTKYICPQCGKKKLTREAVSLWSCSSCESEFAGGAYTPVTQVGAAAKKALASAKRKA